MALLKLALYSNSQLCRSTLSFSKFVTISRTFAATPETLQNGKKNSNEWKSIYKFRYIQSLASANKSKIIVAAFTGIAVPISFAIPMVEPVVVASVGLSLVTTLSLVSFAFRNTIGFMYTKQSRPDEVKFAYLDFWGNRKDIELKIEDVVPFSELPKNVLDPWCTIVQFYSGHEKMKLFYKLGGVSDLNEFCKVFGLDK